MIDWERLACLQAAFGEEDFAEVMAQFLAEADVLVPRLPQLGAGPGLMRDLAFLEEVANMLGFRALAQCCRAEAPLCLDHLQQVYHQSRSVFFARIGGVIH